MRTLASFLRYLLDQIVSLRHPDIHPDIYSTLYIKLQFVTHREGQCLLYDRSVNAGTEVVRICCENGLKLIYTYTVVKKAEFFILNKVVHLVATTFKEISEPRPLL